MFEADSYYSKYTMADLEHMNILTDKCAIYYFELPKIDMTAAGLDTSQVEKLKID